LKVANKALKFIPNHASIYFNVANILGKKGKYEEAEIQFEQAISKNPTAPDLCKFRYVEKCIGERE